MLKKEKLQEKKIMLPFYLLRDEYNQILNKHVKMLT